MDCENCKRLTKRIAVALDEARLEGYKQGTEDAAEYAEEHWHVTAYSCSNSIRALAQRKEEQMGDYQKIIAEDDATIARMRERKEWRTVIVGLPTIRKLLNGEDVTLESFKINLIPDDVLFNNRAQRKEE